MAGVVSQSQPIDEVPVVPKIMYMYLFPFPFWAMNQIIPRGFIVQVVHGTVKIPRPCSGRIPKPKITGDDHWERIFGTVRGPRWITGGRTLEHTG